MLTIMGLPRLSMADFIESLEDCIESAASAASRLRSSLARIDQAFLQAVTFASPTSSGRSGGGDHQSPPRAPDNDSMTEPEAAVPVPVPTADPFRASGPDENDPWLLLPLGRQASIFDYLTPIADYGVQF